MRLSVLFVALALAAAFAAGRLTSPGPAAAGAGAHTYLIRSSDTARVPSRAVTCTASFEAGSPNFFCDHIGKRHRYTVVFYRDSILVLHGPDKVVWSGTP